MGRKTCEKSREWEKERRDKLNVGFNDLYKLLPDHDPSMSLSKMDILRKAAEYIRQLQDQNEKIVKSGNGVLKNETERLRKRVAYLVLKTKDLVSALKAAGVPIPNNKKKKGKNKGGVQKPSIGKDQNLVPPTTGANSTQHITCGVVQANGGKLISGVNSATMNASSTKKVKCGCDKAAKKNPLSEVNGASTKSPVISSLASNVTVVACNSQTHATILNDQNPSVHHANIENTALTSTLGAGTLIFRDGRVITVPPPSTLIPQILVKPQPAVIVMQRATPVAIKRDKFPLIFPKRRDITQTTYMNKAPIPAIKTFRLESPQKTSKSSKAKKKKESNPESINKQSLSKLSLSEKGDQCSVVTSGVVTSVLVTSTVDLSNISQTPPINHRKRKAEVITKRGKIHKSGGSVAVSSKNEEDEASGNLHENIVTNCSNSLKDASMVDCETHKSDGSVAVPSKNEEDEASGNLHENIVTSCSNSLKDASMVDKLGRSEKSPVKSCVDTSEITSGSSQSPPSPVTINDIDSSKARVEMEVEPEAPERYESSFQENSIASEVQSQERVVSQGKPGDTSMKVADTEVALQQTLSSTIASLDSNNLEKENIVTLDSPGIPKGLSSSSSPKCGPVLSLPVPTDIVGQKEIDNGDTVVEMEKIQNVEECPESQINAGICLEESVANNEVLKPFGNQDDRLRKPELFSNEDVNDDPKSRRTKIDIDFKQSESDIGDKSSAESHSKSTVAANEKTTEVKNQNVIPIEPEKLSLHSTSPSHQKNSTDKLVITERSSLVQPVGRSKNVNNQYDLNISESVNPEQMFSFDDTVHSQLDSYSAESTKTQPATCAVVCNSSSNVAEMLPNSNLDNSKKDNLTRQRKSSKDVTDDNNTCIDATHSKIISSQDSAPCKTSRSIDEQLNIQKSNKHVVHDTGDTLPGHMESTCFRNTRSDDNNLLSTNTLIPGMDLEKSTTSMRSFQSQAKVSLMDTVPPSTFASGSQMYSIAMSEPSRTESFFNYDNPIATLPSADPFFSNFMGKTADVGSASCNATPTTCFSYANFTTQTPPVRSVARQLFPADPLCSITNSYNLLNNRQSELETNLPHLSAASTQMFQFSSYSSAGSYRDPVFLANDFVATPTKTGANVGTLENPAQNDKGAAALHPTHNYTDVLNSSANMNNFSNISCNFSVAPSSSSCIPTDFNPLSSTQSKLSHKQFINAPQSILGGNQSKQIPKPCSNEGNFSMNMITSSTPSKSEMKTHSQCSALESTGFEKPINSESSQNLNFNYLHPPSQTHAAQINQEASYNLYMRDTTSLPKNISNHKFRSTNQVAALNSSINSEKNFQKTSSNGLSSLKSSITKEFNVNIVPNSSGSSVENTRGSGDRFSVQSNLFHNTCNQYPDHSSKARRGHSSTGNIMPNFHGGGSSQLSSNNQGVQTQQSYLGSTNTQQAPQMTKSATHIAPSVNQAFSGSTQSSNRQNHLVQPDKYSRVASMNQDLPCVVSGPHYSMKLSGGHSLNNSDATECTGRSHHSQEGYQTVSSLVQTSTTIPSQNQVVFSSSNVFSHSNFSAQHRSYQGPTFSTYSGGSSSNNSQTIYTNPTTAVPSNQVYLQGTNTSSAVGVHRGHSQNILSLNNLTKATPVHNSQLPNPGNLPQSSTGQIFSTVESLAHQNHDIVRHNHKSQNNTSAIGNTIQHPSQTQPAANPSNGNFPGTSTSQSINISNRKSVQNDGMSNFSMSNIAGYSQNMSLGNIENQHSIAKRLHSSGHNYNHLQSSMQNVPVNKTSSQYTPAPNNHLSSSKQCDYPLASILTGLNDPILSGASLTNEANSSHLNKNVSLSGMTDKNSGCREKVVDKQYSTNTEGNSFKTTDNSCSADYLRSKENGRNSFIPIIEDVRLNSEFSNDLFSSLQVPTGGAHSDSISPTAAFLLAFPLVSTSKNTENPHEQDPADNNTSTPTTILQIGNIEPPNSELFHPLEFGKDMETSDYLGQVQDKCKRKESVSQEKHKKQVMSNAYPQTYNFPGTSGDFSVAHYDQPWSENHSKSKPIADRKKNEKTPKQFNNNSNAYEFCKQDKKKKNKISVNWMAAPDANDSFQKEVETSSFPTSNLPFPMDIDGLPDLCSTKKNNSGIYSWSPSKSLLPIDNGLLIPSTLPTLVGDLALGTTTPSDPFSKRCDNKKTLEKQLEKSQNPQKAQNNFLSVSQLVDPKSKKQKIPDTKCKKPEKKKAASFTKRKDTNEPCMYPDNFLPPLGWDKYRYKNNYSAEALIGSQDINESLNFSYQQNANYFMGTDFNQDHHTQNQQYQNSFSFSQNQFSSFVAEEYQNDSFSMNQTQGSSKRETGSDKREGRCRDETTSRFLSGAGANPSHYHHSTSMQPYPAAPLPPSSAASSQPSNFTSNTTTSVTNFNLSTIFPEINERTGSQGQQNAASQQQQNQQQQQQQNNIQHHPHNSMNSFSNNTNNSYRPHNI